MTSLRLFNQTRPSLNLAGADWPTQVWRDLEKAKQMAQELIAELGPEFPVQMDQKILHSPDYIPRELIQKIFAKGFFTAWIPRFLGGGGLHPISMLTFNEELGAYCLGLTNIIGAHYVGVGLISATLNYKILGELVQEMRIAEKTGQTAILSAAITEPEAGSDLEDYELIKMARVQCLMKRSRGFATLSGSKIFISNSVIARWHVVSAYEDLRRPRETLAVVVVPSGSAGVSLGRIERKMGQSLSPAAQLFFQDVRIDKKWICYEKNQFSDVQDYLRFTKCLVEDVPSVSRAGVAALATGVAKATLNICQARRRAEIAEMYANYETARILTWEIAFAQQRFGPMKEMNSVFYSRFERFFVFLKADWARKFLRSQRIKSDLSYLSGLASLAKNQSVQLAQRNIDLGIQLLGPESLEVNLGFEKLLRDFKLLQIYEGTDQLNSANLYRSLIKLNQPDYLHYFTEDLRGH